MTPTQSLSERLRAANGDTLHIRGMERLMREAADSLDAQDVEIAACHGTMLAVVEAAGGLVDGYPTGKHNILQRIRALHDAFDAQDAEIELLKEGRGLHDELADHLEHELAQQSALLAQAAAALEPFARNAGGVTLGEALGHIEREHIEKAHEALAAIRAEMSKI